MTKGWIVALACALLALGAAPLAAQQTSDQQKCINKLNKNGAKVAAAQGKENFKCINFAGKGKLDKLGAATALDCLTTDFKGKVAKKQAKTLTDQGKFCSAPEDIPDFGFTDAATVNSAAIQQPIDLVSDIFGADLNNALADCDVDKDMCKCQVKVIKDTTKIFDTKVKEFLKCKKFALKDTKDPFPSGAASAADLQACVDDAGTPGSIANDAKGKIGKKVDKLGADIVKKCDAAKGGPVDTSVAFPGECAGLTGTALRDCIDERVECRVCKLINTMDELDVDCDVFDDGVANGSCGIVTHKCVLDATSLVEINIQALPVPLSFPATGAIDVGLGAGTTAPTACNIQVLDPINIPAIGVVCISPGSGCPAGVADCDGGSALGIDLVADGNIGACTGNAGCSATCDTYCAGLSAAQFSSSCTGFCTGGSNDGNACNLDADCPGGACNGPEPVGANNQICQCQCLDEAAGAPGVAGELQCRLAASLDVESAAPCDGTDVTIVVGTSCVPMTTATATSEILDANFTASTMGPFSNTGAAISCAQLDASITTGLQLRGAVNFFGSALGDIAAEILVDCQ